MLRFPRIESCIRCRFYPSFLKLQLVEFVTATEKTGLQGVLDCNYTSVNLWRRLSDTNKRQVRSRPSSNWFDWPGLIVKPVSLWTLLTLDLAIVFYDLIPNMRIRAEVIFKRNGNASNRYNSNGNKSNGSEE